MIAVIKSLRPESEKALKRLIDLREMPSAIYEKQGFEIVVHERDAVNLALRMAAFDEKQLTNWYPDNTGECAPFLHDLDTTKLREDSMITHDASVFGSWEQIEKHQVGSVVFQNQTDKLTIFNVNRHQIEKTLGVDLIYEKRSECPAACGGDE